MPARVSLVTLGVSDLARATAFYQALGWPLSSDSVAGEVSFFKSGGVALALWGHESLAGDAGMPVERSDRFRGVALAINVESPEEVDAALAAATEAGADLLVRGHPTDWGGYTGYFADPEGHVWEVAHNPGWPLGPDKLPILP